MAKLNGGNSADTGTDYPDLTPDGLGELHSIKRISGMATPSKVPQIKWGGEYAKWPPERRLRYAERLASSMNHAADILQQERNKLIEVVERQEAQLKSNVKSYVEQGELMHRELGMANAREQELSKLVVQLQKEVREKTSRIAKLEAERGGDS